MRPSRRRSCSDSATSRCWAPSCRLRSRRRRSASLAATMRSREACTSASREWASACRRSFSKRHAGGGADRLDELGIVVERGVVDECGELGAVALDGRGRPIGRDRRYQHGPPVGVGIAERLGQSVGDHEARIAECLGQRLLQPDTARALEVSEQVGQAATGQARAQQPDEEGHRHAHERADRQPQDRLRSRARHEVVGQQRGEEQQGHAPCDARQQRASARARRRPPAEGHHDGDGDRGKRRPASAGPCRRRRRCRRSGRRPAGCRPARRRAARPPA